MLHRHAVFIFLACLSLAFAAAPASAASIDDAGKYVESLGNQALTAIANKNASKDQKQAKLNHLFADNVDFPWVGRFVMGRFWRQASDAQKARYLKEYERFVIAHYTARFTEYTSGTFKITGTKDDGDDEYTVSMQLQSGDPQAEPVLVDYRVRKEDKGFKIFDVIIEGVSMITTQRSEFSSVITDKGIDGLIDLLAAKAKTGDAAMDENKTASK